MYVQWMKFITYCHRIIWTTKNLKHQVKIGGHIPTSRNREVTTSRCQIASTVTILHPNSSMTTCTQATSIQVSYHPIDQDKLQCLLLTVKSLILLPCSLQKTMQSTITKCRTTSLQTRVYVWRIILHILLSMSILILIGLLIITEWDSKTKTLHNQLVPQFFHTNPIHPTILQKSRRIIKTKVSLW